MKTILVTGAAGFIGSNISDYLLKNGFKVIGIDNFDPYYSRAIKEYNLREFIENPNFSLQEVDILDFEKINELFVNNNIDGVIHLAALAGVTDSLKLPLKYTRVNVEGTVSIAEACVKNGCKNLIFASTSSVYGEDLPVPYSEDMPTDSPLSPYPASKKACEVLLKSYTYNYDFNVSILRIFNPVGIRLRPDLALPKLIRAAIYPEFTFPQYWSNPEATARDYVNVKHIAESMLYILENPIKYDRFNLGNSSPVSLADLISTVEEVVGIAPKIEVKAHRKGEMKVTYANVSKAAKMINYNPTTPIKESIKEYYDWFIKQDEIYKKGEL
jgi:UDP-glucuronate 4-epimerase